MHRSEERKRSLGPAPMAAAQVDANGSGAEAGGQMGPGAAGAERTDGGAKAEEAEAPQSRARLKAEPPGEQVEASSGSAWPSPGR